jgi:uncharacterized membrane protein YqaE (UPF0057 family)
MTSQNSKTTTNIAGNTAVFDGGKSIEDIKNKDGVFGKFMVSLLDFIITTIIKLFNDMFSIFFKGGFNFMASREETGITKEKLGKSSAFLDYVYFRYAITLVAPPVGIFLSKGLNGWVNILVAMLLCYMNYFVGIVYAFVITFYNRYPDLYIKNERDNINKYKKELLKENIDIDQNQNTFPAFLVLIGALGVIFYVLLKSGQFLYNTAKK